MEADTTIRVYLSDRDWLQARQRKISFARNKALTMADLMRELLDHVRAQEAGEES